jgi:hypothetical protein
LANRTNFREKVRLQVPKDFANARLCDGRRKKNIEGTKKLQGRQKKVESKKIYLKILVIPRAREGAAFRLAGGGTLQRFAPGQSQIVIKTFSTLIPVLVF